MSCPQIWNIEKEKDRDKEKLGRQAGEAQREKELERERKIKRRHFLLKETTARIKATFPPIKKKHNRAERGSRFGQNLPFLKVPKWKKCT